MLLKGLRYVAWAITGAAVLVYLAMVFVTLPHLAAITRGELVFDLRPLGYDFGIAQDILSRLGTDGAAYYENVQHRLDSAFPLLACLALLYWVIVAGRRWQGSRLPLPGPVLAAILATVVIANAADLGENAGVSAMLAVGPKGLTPGLVEAASFFTKAKTFFSTIAYVSLIVLALGPWVVQLLKRMRP